MRTMMELVDEIETGSRERPVDVKAERVVADDEDEVGEGRAQIRVYSVGDFVLSRLVAG
jgi:hypothetical protein